MRLLLQLIVVSFFSNYAYSNVVTSSSEQQTIHYDDFKLTHSTNNHVSQRHNINKSDFLTKGAFLTIANNTRKKRTFIIKILSTGNAIVYLYSPSGKMNVRQIHSGESIRVEFDKNGKKSKSVFFIMESEKTNKIVFKVDDRSELFIKFKKKLMRNYCRLSVIDAKGGISFNNHNSKNYAGFIYATDNPKYISLSSHVTGRYENGNRFSNDFKNVFLKSLKYYKLKSSAKVLIRNHSNNLLRQKEIKLYPDNKYEINGTGRISIVPFISMDKYQLKAGRYQINTTVTCN